MTVPVAVAAGRTAAGGAARGTAARTAGQGAGASRTARAAEIAAIAPVVTPDAPSGGSSKGSTSRGKATAGRAVSWAWAGNRKILTAQFLLCVVILGLGTLLAPQGSKDGMPRALVKGSALCGVFLVLSLVTTGGKGPAKAATAIATLITAAYVLTSSDVHNVVSWLNAFFSKDGDVKTSTTPPTDVSPDIPGSDADADDTDTGGGVIQA